MADTLLYQHPSAHAAAARLHPGLVTNWLLNTVLPRVDKQARLERERKVRKAQADYLDWQHDIEKISTYTKWPPARLYQDFIVAELRKAFDHLVETGELPSIEEPEHIIERATRTLVERSQLLNRVEGPARVNMRTYFADQVQRLRAFAEVAVGLENPAELRTLLGRPPAPLHERLNAEARRTSGPVAVIYARAIRETQP